MAKGSYSPTIFNGDFVKTLKDSLKLGENVKIITGDSDDPTSVAKDAPIGSLYFRDTTSKIYKKRDGGSSTNWRLMSSEGGVAREVTAGSIECDFETVLAGFNYCNTNATSSEPLVLKVITGNHDVTDTLAHTNIYFIGMRGEHNTNLEAATGLTNKPMLTSNTDLYLKEINLDGSTLTNYGDLTTEILISLSGSSYVEFLNMYLYGGYHGLKIDGQIEFVGDFISIFNAENDNVVLDNGAISYFATCQISNSTTNQITVDNTTTASPSTKITLVDTQIVQTLGGGLSGTANGLVLNDDSRAYISSGTQIFRFDKGLITNDTSSAQLRDVTIDEGFTTYCIEANNTSTINIISGAVDGTKLNIGASADLYMNTLDTSDNATIIGSNKEVSDVMFKFDRGYGTNNPSLNAEPAYILYDGAIYKVSQLKSGADGGILGIQSTVGSNTRVSALQFSASTTNFNGVNANVLVGLAYSDFDPASPVVSKYRAWESGILAEDASNSLGYRIRYFDGVGFTDAINIDTSGNSTLAGLAIGSSTTMSDIKDEDDMSSDSATALATQQSIKAYADKDVIVSKSTTYTAVVTDKIIKCDSSGGAFTITLYAASGNAGRRLIFIKTSSDYNAVTIDGNASETINGNLTSSINTQWERLELICDGTNWLVLQRECNYSWKTSTATIEFNGAMTIGNGTISSKERRVEKNIEISIYMQVGSSSVFGGDYQVKMPTGLLVDTGDVPDNFHTLLSSVTLYDNSGTTAYEGNCLIDNNATGYVEAQVGDTGGRLTNANPVAMAVNDEIWTTVSIPVDGWKSETE